MSGDYQELVEHLMGEGWPICEAKVEAVQIKAGGVKLTLVVEGEIPLHALADVAGGTVLLVVDSTQLGKTAGGDARQDDLFVSGQEESDNKPPPAPPAAFNPTTDLPPDDDLSTYENPTPDEDEDGIFNEAPDKPPWQ
ncbi:MAG: hypothetical protein V3V08_07135 [Nannocystaceae bacterium]